MLPRSVVILICITVGLPALVLAAMISVNTGVNPRFLSTIVYYSIIGSFGALMLFEIKRLVDTPAETPADERAPGGTSH